MSLGDGERGDAVSGVTNVWFGEEMELWRVVSASSLVAVALSPRELVEATVSTLTAIGDAS